MTSPDKVSLPRILLVDEDGLAGVVGETLEAAGFSVRRVSSFAEAEAALASGEWDRIVLGRQIRGLGAGGGLADQLTAENNRLTDELARRTRELQTLRESFHEMAMIDPLTGLHSRRFVLEAVDNEMRRARRYHHVLSLILLDIDHLAEINERLGREAGDMALAHVARLVRGRLRDTDVLARKAEDEFAAVLPRTEEIGARTAAWDLVATVAARPMLWEDERVPLSISAGVAAWKEGYASPQDLWEAAERALTRAKEEGRGRAAMEAEARA